MILLAALMLAEVFAADAMVMIVVHAPGEHEEIHINPLQITHLHSSRTKNREMTEETECVIAMSDGRYVSSVESCDKVREMIKGLEDGKY